MTASYSSPAGVCRYYSHIVSYNIPIFPIPMLEPPLQAGTVVPLYLIALKCMILSSSAKS